MNALKKMVILSVIVIVVIGVILFYRGHKPRQLNGEQIELLMYCAAGVKSPVLAAAQQYEKDYGVRIRMQYGGSGTLLSNLQVAKTGDLYLAGDSSYTDIGRKKGLLAEVLPVGYLTPVVALKKGSGVKINTVEDLLKPGLRLAIGNPDAASIGKQTRLVMEKAGLWDKLSAHVTKDGVFKPTVPEIANDVALGAADAGIIWDATVKQHPDLVAVHLPEFDNARKQITVAVLKTSKLPTDALRFARYLNSTVGNAIFKEHGFEPVEGDEWAYTPKIIFFCGSVNRKAIGPVIDRFMKREGCSINAVYNGCGILTGQMRSIRQHDNGVGFPDVYMPCDQYYLHTVSDWFQDAVTISDTKIVIVVQPGNPKGIKDLKDLTRPGIRVSVGQPEQCTIGALTRIMLQNAGLWDAVMKNVVTQTASSSMLVPTVITKSVDATLAYQVDTRAEADKLTVIPIDSKDAQAVEPFAIARSSRYKYLDRRLLDTVTHAREDFEKLGFNFRAGNAEAN